MDGKEAKSYFRTLGEITAGGDKTSVRKLVQEEKETPEFLEALDTLKKLKQPRPADLQSLQHPSPTVSPTENPILTETTTENSDSFNHEAAIHTAYSVLDKYKELKSSIAEKSKLPGREGVKKDRAQLATLLHSTAKTAMDDPRYFEPLFSTWKAQPIDEGGKESHELYEEVKKKVAEFIKKDPGQVREDHFASWLQIYTKNILIRDIGESALTEFFSVQKGEKQRVDAAYDFALMAANFTEDVDVLRVLKNVLQLKTPIIPIQSDYYYDSFIGRVTVKDDLTAQKAGIVQELMINLEDLVRGTDNTPYENLIDNQRARHIEYWGEKISKAKLSSYIDTSDAQAIKMFGLEKVNRIKAERNTVKLYLHSPELDTELSDELLADVKVIRRTFLPKSDVALEKRAFIEANPGEYQTVSIQTGNVTLEVLIPEGLSKNEALGVVSHLPVRDWIDDVDIVTQRTFIINGKAVGVIEHKTFEETAEIHPISIIADVGIPRPEGEGSLAERNAKLAAEIRIQQRRFLDDRGVITSIENEELIKLGYEKIAFVVSKEFPPRSIAAVLLILKHPYGILLDENFNLDFEGQSFQGSQQDELQHLLLTYLRPILCDELENDKGQKLSEHTLTVLKRKAHIRCLPLLPDGRPSKATSEQAKVYLKEQGRDLATTNLEKQIAGDCRENRGFHNHTYVKAVERENAPDSGPQKLSINPDLGY